MSEGRGWIYWTLGWRRLCSSGLVPRRLVSSTLIVRRPTIDLTPLSVLSNRLSSLDSPKSHRPFSTHNTSELPRPLLRISLYARSSDDAFGQDSNGRRVRSSLC